MKRLITIFLLLLANALGSQPAYAKNSDQYLLSQAYFEDKSNSLSISQIEQQEFIPYQEALTGGYKTGTFWLKLKIAASTQPLILKIRPVFIEEIELFDSVLTQQKPLVGNKYPWKASDIEAVSYNFELELAQQTEIFISELSPSAAISLMLKLCLLLDIKKEIVKNF